MNAIAMRGVAIPPFGLAGTLRVPAGATCLVVIAHGSGSSRFSPRNNAVAEGLGTHGAGGPGGIAAVMAAGLGIGAVSGIIVVRLHLPAIIVTPAGSFIIVDPRPAHVVGPRGGAALRAVARPQSSTWRRSRADRRRAARSAA